MARPGTQESSRSGASVDTSGKKYGEHRRNEALKSPQRTLSLDDLGHNEGPPLSTRELALIIGMSTTFVRTEIRTGHLRAVAVGRGRKRVFRITVDEARRYARALGLL